MLWFHVSEKDDDALSEDGFGFGSDHGSNETLYLESDGSGEGDLFFRDDISLPEGSLDDGHDNSDDESNQKTQGNTTEAAWRVVLGMNEKGEKMYPKGKTFQIKSIFEHHKPFNKK